jgi:F0F1-type ATP synthase membrane subunit c/vacuolar-type H+-ATPase subunit K
MAQIISIYGLVAAVIISNNLTEKMALHTAFLQLGAGLAVGLCGLAAGFAIGIIGDAGGQSYLITFSLFLSLFLFFLFSSLLLLSFSPLFLSFLSVFYFRFFPSFLTVLSFPFFPPVLLSLPSFLLFLSGLLGEMAKK